MIYDFEDGAGNLIGFEYPMGKAPKIGASIRRKGKLWRRIPSAQLVQVMEYQCIDHGLPRRDIEIRAADGRVLKPGVDPKTGIDHHPLTRTYKNVDKMGRPVFRSQREVRTAYSHEHVKRQDIVYGR